MSSHLLRFEPLICSARNNNAERKFSLAATDISMGWGKTYSYQRINQIFFVWNKEIESNT